MKRRSESETAFTLTELLVVIAILGVLAALLLPAISRAKSKAQQSYCVGNLHQLGLGLQNFVSENHAYPSAISGTNTDNPGSWIRQLQRGGFNISQPATNFLSKGLWNCPSAQFPRDIHSRGVPLSYAYNAHGTGGSVTNALGLMGHFVSMSAMFSPIKETEVVAPSEMMAIGDSLSGGLFFSHGELTPNTKSGLERKFRRHQGRVNVAVCDGHVESPTLTFAFQDTNDVALVHWNRDHLPHRRKL
jgi:prepilin-type N-terminal cleavage/methylation domain-containing protein/prepilin-type processing-associated H-X9-DG protein